jgi:hypothetical protein
MKFMKSRCGVRVASFVGTVTIVILRLIALLSSLLISINNLVQIDDGFSDWFVGAQSSTIFTTELKNHVSIRPLIHCQLSSCLVIGTSNFLGLF